MMTDKKITENESLQLITEMITLAKGNANQSFFHIILWGWVIIGISLLEFYLLKFSSLGNTQLVWLLTIPASIVSGIYGYKKGKQEKTRTYVDSMYASIWFSFGISLVIILLITGIGNHFQSIISYILVLAGMATLLSGKLIKFKPLIWGGVSFWVWSLVALSMTSDYQLIVHAIAIFMGYIVPGYMLKNKLKKG